MEVHLYLTGYYLLFAKILTCLYFFWGLTLMPSFESGDRYNKGKVKGDSREIKCIKLS